MQASPLFHSLYSLVFPTRPYFLVHLLEKMKAAERAKLMRRRVWPWVSQWGEGSCEWTVCSN